MEKTKEFKRSNQIVLNFHQNRSRKEFESVLGTTRKEIENQLKKERSLVKSVELEYERKKEPWKTSLLEVKVTRIRKRIENTLWNLMDNQSKENRKKKAESCFEYVLREFKKNRKNLNEANETKSQSNEVLEWKEQVARVGTGYRVRKDEKDSRKRRFDVGYADLKTYLRKEGREVVIDSSNIGRTLTAKGKNARVKVINAVCDMEKRRPVSEYTGSGILRKSIVGKLKLKSTKSGSKE